MKALFLAGGKGSRLEPLTNTIPKPMVPLMNKPLLEMLFMNLKKYRIDDIIISCCYRSSYIIDYFGNGNSLGLNIKYIIEETPLGTGGAIKKAVSLIKDTFIVFYADIVSDIDITKMINLHKKSKVDVTIATSKINDPSPYGLVEDNGLGYVTSFVEKPKSNKRKSSFINAGVYILEPTIIEQIPKKTMISLEKDIFPLLLKNRIRIAVYKNNKYWIDIGTPGKYIQVHKDILVGNCDFIKSSNMKDYKYIGKDATIHSSSKIGKHVFIGNNVLIGPNTIIENSVIGNNISIGSECKIIDSIIWNNVQINKNVSLKEIIVLSDSIIDSNLNYLSEIYLKKIVRYV